jgi:hypothetical protein
LVWSTEKIAGLKKFGRLWWKANIFEAPENSQLAGRL